MSELSTNPIVVAGHICLDVIPRLESDVAIEPGRLVEIGAATLSTGGAVANAGLALHRLGQSVRLVGRVGDDLFGRAIRDVLDGFGGGLGEFLSVAPGETTSYSVVISPPGVDRTFLHCPGANHGFTADDVSDEAMAGGSLLHFGYPPIMRNIYANRGAELVTLLRRAASHGLGTSLDMCDVDPQSEAGAVAWPGLLEDVLPHVDLFQPSVEELAFMLEPGRFEALGKRPADGDLVASLAERCLEMGCAIAAIKLGEHGLALFGGSSQRIASSNLPVDAQAWAGKRLIEPCYVTEVVGATGSGDCTVAGMLAAVAAGQGPEPAMRTATAVGACSVEAPDATSGVPDWNTVQQRIDQGWRKGSIDPRFERT